MVMHDVNMKGNQMKNVQKFHLIFTTCILYVKNCLKIKKEMVSFYPRVFGEEKF